MGLDGFASQRRGLKVIFISVALPPSAESTKIVEMLVMCLTMCLTMCEDFPSESHK
jgi:hypothetical protein